MADWRKTQYRLGPKPDPLDDPMAGENLLIAGGIWALVLAFVACVGYLALWAFGVL